MKNENLLDLVAHHEKWHSKSQGFRKKYLYNTNDFLIEEIFNRMQIENGTFVEFGAWDGIHLSNTRKLFEQGWKGLLIEPDSARFKQLKENYAGTEVKTINAFLNTTDCLIDSIVDENLQENIDFCSIDIDGLDLEIFETFYTNLPKVVCIEGGQVLHPLAPPVSREVASANIQQSLKTMIEIFDSKGYKLICSYQDSIFVKKEYYSLFNVEENIVNQYIEGLRCLPRIPYILSLLGQFNIKNDIIEAALEGVNPHITDYVSTHGTSAQKKAWVDQFYPLIDENLKNLKESQ